MEWVNPLNEEEEVVENEPIYQVVKKLIKDAQKFKSFSSLMHLHAVKSLLELREKYRLAMHVRNPIMRASFVVAKSVGKGPYFAQKIPSLTRYVGKFRTLPPTTAGKHNAHPSLLNNERLAQSVRRYLTVLADGEVRVLRIFFEFLLILFRSLH